jgi:hypothetical protein
MRRLRGRGGLCEEIAESIEHKNIQFSAELSGMVDLFDRNSVMHWMNRGVATQLIRALSMLRIPHHFHFRRNAFGKKPRQPPL